MLNADLGTVSVKGIRTQLKEELGVEAPHDYDKDRSPLYLVFLALDALRRETVWCADLVETES